MNDYFRSEYLCDATKIPRAILYTEYDKSDLNNTMNEKYQNLTMRNYNIYLVTWNTYL